jgi:hypothetical protein
MFVDCVSIKCILWHDYSSDIAKCAHLRLPPVAVAHCSWSDLTCCTHIIDGSDSALEFQFSMWRSLLAVLHSCQQLERLRTVHQLQALLLTECFCPACTCWRDCVETFNSPCSCGWHAAVCSAGVRMRIDNAIQTIAVYTAAVCTAAAGSCTDMSGSV